MPLAAVTGSEHPASRIGVAVYPPDADTSRQARLSTRASLEHLYSLALHQDAERRHELSVKATRMTAARQAAHDQASDLRTVAAPAPMRGRRAPGRRTHHEACTLGDRHQGLTTRVEQ